MHHNQYAGGLATVADALVALKKAVYEESRLTLRELREALADNFAGREVLRQRLLNRYPKFGNDDDEVDGIAAEIAECFCREVLKYRDPVVIASLQNLGFSLPEARGYVHYGCCNPHLPGWEPQLREYQHSLVKCLELALHNGRDP